MIFLLTSRPRKGPHFPGKLGAAHQPCRRQWTTPLADEETEAHEFKGDFVKTFQKIDGKAGVWTLYSFFLTIAGVPGTSDNQTVIIITNITILITAPPLLGRHFLHVKHCVYVHYLI